MKERILQIISAYCLKSITDKELGELKAWIKEDINHKNIFDQYLLTYQKYRESGIINAINIEEAWEKIEHKKKKIKIIHFRKILQYAAAILIPIGLIAGIWLMTQDGFNLKREIAYQPIPPGTQGAELILSNGQVIPLESDTSYQIKEFDGTNIINKAAKLSYKSIYTEPASKGAIIYNTLITKKGKESFVELSDGTKVWVNAKTILKYPVTFNEKTRTVELTEGEAYFEVAKETDRPFIVKVNDYHIKVKGTSFNISSYMNDDLIHTTLTEGSVEINSIKGLPEESFTLEPNQQFSFNKSNLKAEIKEVDVSIYNSWVYGRFSFDESRLEDIFKILERWYHIDVFYDDYSAKNELFTGELPRFEDLNKILRMIEHVSNVKFIVDDNVIQVTTN